MRKTFFCNILLRASNSTKTETLNITSNSMDTLEKKIIEKSFEFANENSFYMPLNYFIDNIHPCFEDESCQEVYVKFIDSNWFDEDNFYIFWENEMKRYGRMR